MFTNEGVNIGNVSATGQRTVPVPFTFWEELSYMVLAFPADKMRSVTFLPTSEAISYTEISIGAMLFG